jgi:hypothetical protein
VAGVPAPGASLDLAVLGDRALFNVFGSDETSLWSVEAGEDVARRVEVVGNPEYLSPIDARRVGDVVYMRGTTELGGDGLWKIDFGDNELGLIDPRIASSQRARNRRNVARVRVRGTEDLFAQLDGEVRMERRWRPLLGQAQTIGAGATATLKLATKGKRTWKTMRRGLERGRRIPVRLDLSAVDDAGNSKRTRKLVRVR